MAESKVLALRVGSNSTSTLDELTSSIGVSQSTIARHALARGLAAIKADQENLSADAVYICVNKKQTVADFEGSK